MSQDRAADAGVTVCEAAPDDRLGVRRVLDAAMLDVREDLPERVDAGDVLVACGATDRIVGALVLVPQGHEVPRSGDPEVARVDAVAVRRARRGQGIGSVLVRAAAERHGRLTAEFDPDVRPFYESLGFEVEAVEGERGGEGADEADRFRGRYESQSA